MKEYLATSPVSNPKYQQHVQVPRQLVRESSSFRLVQARQCRSSHGRSEQRPRDSRVLKQEQVCCPVRVGFPLLPFRPYDQGLCHHSVVRSSPTVANLTHQLRAFQQQHLNPLASPSTKSIQLAITAQKGIALDQDTLSRDLTLLAKEQDGWLKTLNVNGLPPAAQGVASDTASIASATTSADAALYDGKPSAFIRFTLYLTFPHQPLLRKHSTA